jgi:uncharacterized membrane protein
MPKPPLTPRQVRWVRRLMTVTLLGLLVFLIGLNPDLVGMNRSPAVGFVQVGVWLAGLAVFLLGAYGALRVVRNGRPTTLLNDIGLRLAASGYVIAAAASLADFIGIGSHTIRALVFGKIQVTGLVVGFLLIVIGLVLYYPRRPRGPAATEESTAPPAVRGGALGAQAQPAKSGSRR